MDNNYISVIITAVLAWITWLYKHEKEKRLQVENQLSEKKFNVYIKFIELYFQIFEATKLGKKITETEMTKIMIPIKKDLIIYGNDKVIKKFFSFEECSSKGSKNSLRPVADVIIEMRKDMGSPKTKITIDDFLRSMVRNDDNYIQLKKDGIF